MTKLIWSVIAVAIAFGVVGCDGDLDPEWELNHDRIVAVRATPPGILAGGRAELDALISIDGVGTSERVPEQAIVVSPTSLASALAFEDGKWIVTAPDEAAIAAARVELKLKEGDPVPLTIGVAFLGQKLNGIKAVVLGESRTNPTLDAMMVNGAAADPAQAIVVGNLVDVPLSITAEVEDDVNWLTSCGTMHDYDLPEAYLHVEEDDSKAGELAVVRRDERGGVVWHVWTISAQ